MRGDWRKLAFAAAAVVAAGAVCAQQAHAQTAAAKSAQPGKAKKAAAKTQEPADAQQSIDTALKLLEDGKSQQAEEALTALLKGGKLPPAIMAKALLYRGIAYRQQKKPAQAIADLTAALWVKGGLGEADRKDALRQRTSAYQEAGLSDSGDPIAEAMPGTGRAPSARTASVSGRAEEESPPAPAQQGSGWSLANPFAALFGGGSSSAPRPPPQESGPSGGTASIEPSPRRPASSAWSSTTQVRAGGGSESNGGSARAPAAAETRAAPVRPEGKFRVQVGLARTEAEAQALAAKVMRDHAGVLAAREPEIDQAVVGNMGSFYRVRIGPYASAGEGQAACAKLRRASIDCMVVTQ
jgi:hypothetical protein